MSKDFSVTAGFDLPDFPPQPAFPVASGRTFSLSIQEDGRVVLEYNATEHTSAVPIPKDGWVKSVYVDGVTGMYWAEKRVEQQRFRVKPWNKRWWKPWDSIETYTADETIWHDLGSDDEQGKE